MHWLQTRLNELRYTHQDLQQALAKQGIVRVRATITGWTNGKPISLFTSPENTKILADTLQWTVFDLFIAAGYELDIPPDVITFIRTFHNADDAHQKTILEGLRFVQGFYVDFQEFTDDAAETSDDDIDKS